MERTDMIKGLFGRRVATLAMMILTTVAGMAQGKEFTLEDLNYGGTNYHNMSPKNIYTTWWGDKLVRRDAETCSLINTDNGKETALFGTEDINKWAGTDEKTKIRSLYGVRFPYADKTLVLVNNRKERMLIDFKAGKTVWRQACEGETNADWNSVSRAVAFVRDNQLFVTDATGKTIQLSTDGSREIVYGQAVHRNEFGITGGTFWNKEGNRLAFYRMDQSMVTDYPQVNTFTRAAEYEPDKYPMAGMTSHKVTVGVYDMASGKTVYLKAGDPTDRYFTNITWSPDSKTIYMQELNRDQNHMQLACYNAETGDKTGVIYEEWSDKYVEPANPLTFLPWDNGKFILQSQRDGFNHLYLFDTRKRVYPEKRQTAAGVSYKEQLSSKQLTKGSFVIQELIGLNSKRKSVIVRSNELSPIQSNLFAVNTATGKRTQLDNGKGVHYGILSENGTLLCDKYSEPDVPRNIEIINTGTAKRNMIFSAPDPWTGYNVPEYSCGTIKAADGTTDLYFRMVKPIGFDPKKKYPTVIYVYGGPHAHNVGASWHYMSRSWETYMAQKGYLLFILDNRGSENRGLAFEQATFRHLGQEEMKDQMKGVEFLKSLPYVDADRMGVHGWSYGGFMTISLMTNYPDVFKVGVAGGPVIDWKWYEVMYGERYMDTPESNPEGYEQTSLLAKAKDLKGKLQIIIGMNDPTVVPQHALQFINACTEAGTQPDFFVYPGEGHNMAGHKSVHLHERITQYFEDYLK